MTALHSSIEMQHIAIPDLPATGYYIPNFISEEEETRILASIQQLPSSRWTVLRHRRLLSLPTQLTGAARDTLISSPLPQFLDEPILSRFEELGVFADSPHNAPNHVLVNEYKPGEGIMPHGDGPAYHPVTATISLRGHTVLDIYQKTEAGDKQRGPTWRILQEPRSLLVTTGDMYKDTLHGIAEVDLDDNLTKESVINWAMLGNPELFRSGSAKRNVRTSLTYRDVLKVAKLGGALKFINKK